MRLAVLSTAVGIEHAIAIATAGDIPTAIAGRRLLTAVRIATATVIAIAVRIVEESGHE
jgi:hypothetical protein